MFQLKSIYVLLVLFAVHTSAKGQWSSDGRTWGDSTFISQPGCVAVHSYEIYEDSTMYGVFSETVYDNCIYNHRTTKTNQKYPSVNL